MLYVEEAFRAGSRRKQIHRTLQSIPYDSRAMGWNERLLDPLDDKGIEIQYETYMGGYQQAPAKSSLTSSSSALMLLMQRMSFTTSYLRGPDCK